jgi:hypothetical protein
MSEKLVEKLSIRLDGPLRDRVESHAQRLEKSAGVRVSRSEIARKILEIGLDHLDSCPTKRTK